MGKEISYYPEYVARFYDVIYSKIRAGTDSEYYLKQILKTQGPVLELGVGTGRLFVDALKQGADIYGIDALVPAEDSDYDIVRDYVTLYGIEFESCSQSTPVAEDTDGSLTFTNDQGRDTILQVPPGAVYQPTQVNISQILLPPNLPSDFNYTGDGFKLTAIVSGTTHSGSIQSAVDILSTYTLTVEFDGSGLSNAQESNLGLYCWQDGGWVKELSSHVDTTLNTILATPDHFSIWAVLGKDSFPIYLPLILTVP